MALTRAGGSPRFIFLCGRYELAPTGGARGPSIAQLLDQNLLSPQQASSSQNIGELVRPFTNHAQRAPAGSGVPSRAPASRGLGLGDGHLPVGLLPPLRDASRGGASAPMVRGPPSVSVGARGAYTAALDARDGCGSNSSPTMEPTKEEEHEDIACADSPTASTDHGRAAYGHSAGGASGTLSGRASSSGTRGPFSSRSANESHSARLPAAALQGLKRKNSSRPTATSSLPQSCVGSRHSSRPPSASMRSANLQRPGLSRQNSTGLSRGGSRLSASAGVGLGGGNTAPSAQRPQQRVRRFNQPPPPPPPPQQQQQQMAMQAGQLPVMRGQQAANGQRPHRLGGATQMLAVAVPGNATQLAAMRAAASSRQPTGSQRAQALNAAYGGGVGAAQAYRAPASSSRPPGQPRRTLGGMTVTGGGSLNSSRRPSVSSLRPTITQQISVKT